MLVTRQAVLRQFWYPVIPISHLETRQPQAFELLGEKVVLWLDDDGQPNALRNRCCHRSAMLSNGEVINGSVRCPYHGWSYNGKGGCVNVPQLAIDQPIPASYKVPAYRCTLRYGYVWVCLDEPLMPIPNIPQAQDPKFRLIPEFYERWECSGLRIMENSFDNAHFSFVHQSTFGDIQNPEPASIQVTMLENGLNVKTQVPVLNPPLQQANLKILTETTLRTNDTTWYLPFTRILEITYPNGLIHVIVTVATPINDRASQIVQFCLRNDTEADARAEEIIAFDRTVTSEDRTILEATDYDVPLDLRHEQHMASDQPGVIMRLKFTALLKAHGEIEQRR
jgi:phenylpropionate dioxygenase-like ring-hydroxylating dioxygenase large terminal subunit